jgi:hypothetical protein
MANLVQYAKFGCKWRYNELATLNINVIKEDVETFFGNADLPQLMISSVVDVSSVCTSPHRVN